MELKPGYKQTELGVIPEDWVVAAVGEKGQVLAGKALAVNAPGKQRPYLRTKNVFDGRIDIEDVLSMPMTDEQFSQFQLRHGDVLLNEGQSLELVGRCSIYKEEYPEPCAIQNALLRFRANKGTSAFFASHLFRHCQQAGIFAKIALQTTSVAHLGSSRFANLKLAWPTENEQRLIAAALDELDVLLSSLEAAITKKTSLKQAAMQELLTGKRRLPGFEGEWDEVQLGDIAAIRDVKAVASSMPAETQCIELECIEQGSGRLLMSNHPTGESTKYTFKKGDVLFGRLRAYLRKFWLASFDGVCSTEIWPLIARDERLSAGFLHLLVQTNDFIDAACISYGTHMPRSDWGVLRKFQLKLPPRPEQDAIATVMADIDAELSDLVQRSQKAACLKQGMMQQLLTGKIRLT